MQYTFKHRGDEPETTLKTVLSNYDDLPSWSGLTDDQQTLLFDVLIQDDYLGQLIVIREQMYSMSEAVDGDLDGADVIEREAFRAAEWIRSVSHLYTAERVADELDLSSNDGRIVPTVTNGRRER